MSGIQYTNPYSNPLARQNIQSLPLSQYGVNTGSSLMSGLSGLASMVPVVGPMLGAGMNLIAQGMQNRKQEEFYNKYMSPSAQMSQMMAAGINPAAAAQGISGSPAPSMQAAAPTSAFSSLGEALGQSVNSALSAQNLAAQNNNLNAQTKSIDLQNKIAEVELGMKPSMLSAELDDLRESANERRQNIQQSNEEIKEIKKKIEVLNEQKEYIIGQQGQIEFENQLTQAETALKQAEKRVANEQEQLTRINKEIAEKDKENYLTPKETIQETAKATSEQNPRGRLLLSIEEDMNRELASVNSTIAYLEKKFGKNSYHLKPYYRQRNAIYRKYSRRMRRVDKGASFGGKVAGTGVDFGT